MGLLGGFTSYIFLTHSFRKLKNLNTFLTLTAPSNGFSIINILNGLYCWNKIGKIYHLYSKIKVQFSMQPNSRSCISLIMLIHWIKNVLSLVPRLSVIWLNFICYGNCCGLLLFFFFCNSCLQFYSFRFIFPYSIDHTTSTLDISCFFNNKYSMLCWWSNNADQVTKRANPAAKQIKGSKQVSQSTWEVYVDAIPDNLILGSMATHAKRVPYQKCFTPLNRMLYTFIVSNNSWTWKFRASQLHVQFLQILSTFQVCARLWYSDWNGVAYFPMSCACHD